MNNKELPNCRFCGQALKTELVNLGMSPLCQTQIRPDQLNSAENFYPLRVLVCQTCFLVQLEEFVTPEEIFTEYAYFSSYSDSWVAHAKAYCESMRSRLSLSRESLVMEIASNDGYLLQHFIEMAIPVVGIEPASNVAKVAMDKGIRTENRFLGTDSARDLVKSYGQANLVLGNNVLAHVPDINDFVEGIKTLLDPRGTVTMEFPHLVKLMALNQYDTIYHEHFSYLSWYAVSRIFEAHGLELFDVEELPTHGGSLRIYGKHASDDSKTISKAAQRLAKNELDWGVNQTERYLEFTKQVEKSKRDLLAFLIEVKNSGKRIVGYGAPGKGNTLLNYCGIRTDFLEYTVDRNPYKQGTYTPGTHIPIFAPEKIAETRPEYILVLPWNLRDELTEQLSYIRDWGGRLVFPIPDVAIV